MEKICYKLLAVVGATTMISACDMLNPPPTYRTAVPPQQVAMARQNAPVPPKEQNG